MSFPIVIQLSQIELVEQDWLQGIDEITRNYLLVSHSMGIHILKVAMHAGSLGNEALKAIAELKGTLVHLGWDPKAISQAITDAREVIATYTPEMIASLAQTIISYFGRH